MANEQWKDNRLPNIVLIPMIVIIALSLLFLLLSSHRQASNAPVVTPTVQPTVIVPSPPIPVAPIEVVPTPTPPPIIPSVQQPELVTPSVPTPPPAIREEVAEVKEHVAKTADDLIETIEEFRKKADDLDLGE